MPQTKVGLKKKLRNDLWSDPNIEVKMKKKKKVININNNLIEKTSGLKQQPLNSLQNDYKIAKNKMICPKD
ncbi:hypothetical protein BpHYR1_013355 [Brachionus plicatilis]|uniref:Uncharacterized protein n=1 Tax=Brachionus plicatilis TaxID=10195 RepID=A0A3M7QU63_BRAPC|nr:hypothetical protein BpHYR1_013355 [Brachionus plicatilis]